MNASRVFFISLLMLAAIWAKPIWAQDSSNSATQSIATTPGEDTNSNASPDWKKKEVKVPNVVGLWRDEAILDLFKAGLRVGDIREETSTSVAHNHVISESPAAGTEAEVGSKVDLVIARAPEVKVPDVVGLTLSAAKAVLDKVDLKIGRIEERPSTSVAAGLIISQHPRAGTEVREDRRVRLVVSKGTSEDTVPNVVGATQAVATTEITSAGLILGTVTMQSSATVATGVVISESPSAGSNVAPKSPVNLVVSSGVARVAVPNVVGLGQTAATTAITGAGLTIGTVAMQSSTTVATGLIISESPAAGTSVASGSAVSLIISSGLPQVLVPNVVGLTQGAAGTAITGVGLKVGAVTMQSSSTVAAGLVISESPNAGTSVVANSAVNLLVSNGVAKVAVPNVLGRTQAAATTAITGAGLTVGTVTMQSNATVAAGLVISESPSAGTSVVSGSAVNIVISSGAPSGTSTGGSPITVPGVGQVIFPAGYLSGSTTATLLLSNTEAIATALATGSDILGPLTQATNEVHLQFSSAPLTAGYFNISLNLPGELQSAISQGGQPTILAAFHYLSQDSEAAEDSTDFDQIDNVSYDPTTQIVSGQVPISAIDTIFGSTLEVVLKIVVFPPAQTAPAADTAESIKKEALALGSAAGGQTTSPPLLYPLVAVPPLIIGPFGEPGHAGGAHGGIDLRTLGTGKQVQAVADGWISQITLSSGKTNCCASPQPAYCGTVAAAPATYAKPGANPYTLSVVQQLNSGGAVAYRHLTFGSVSVSGVTSISSQLCYVDKGSHAISVKQGDSIALSGDSGAPGAPHLHFEYTSQSAGGAINSQHGAFRQNGIFQLGQLEMAPLGQKVSASSPMSLGLTAAGSQVQAQVVASTAAQILVRRYKPTSPGNADTNGCYAGEVCLPATAQDTGTSATFQTGSSYPIFAFSGPPTLWSGYDPTVASITNPAVKNTQCSTLANGISTDCGLYTIGAANGSAAGASTSATYTLTPKGRYVGAAGAVSTESTVWNLGGLQSLVAQGINSSGTIVGWVCPSGTIPTGQAGCQVSGAPSAVATIAGKQYKLSSLTDLTPCGFDLTNANGTIAVAVSETGSILIEGNRSGPPLAPGGPPSLLEASCLLTPAAAVNGVPQFTAVPQASPELGINSAGTIVGWVCPSGTIPTGQAGCQVSGVPSAVATIVGQNGARVQYNLSNLADLTPCGFDLAAGTTAVAVSEIGSILIEGNRSGPPLAPGGPPSLLEASCLLTPVQPPPANGVPQFSASPLATPELGINSSGTIVGWVCPSGTIPTGQAGCQVSGAPSAVATIVVQQGQPGKQYGLSSLADLTPCGFDLANANGTIAVAVSETGSILIEGNRSGPPLAPGGPPSLLEASCLLTPVQPPPVNGVPQFVATPL